MQGNKGVRKRLETEVIGFWCSSGVKEWITFRSMAPAELVVKTPDSRALFSF